MKLTLQVKLLPTDEQSRLLAATQQQYSQLCNYLSILVHQTHVTNPHSMYYQFNRDLRFTFDKLPAAMHTCARAKVAGAYRSRITTARRKKRSTSFKEHCAFKPSISVDYSKLLYSVCQFESVKSISDRCYTAVLSIATISGRQKIQALLSKTLVDRRPGVWKQASLNYRKSTKEWYFHIVYDVKEPEVQPHTNYLGVDLGITNIASTSDGTIYTGKSVDDKRLKYYSHVRRLQKQGTRSSRRRLRSINRQMSYFIRTLNHTIAKLIVQTAQRTESCIVLEELKYIFDKLKARKSGRLRMFGWSFAQLRDFITYKARLASILVKTVDPRYTSQTCPVCGHVARNNRKGEKFKCRLCNHTAHADTNGGVNIARLGGLACY